MQPETKAISWLVLPEDKQFFHDLAPKEGKQKWKIFNEMTIAFQEKREREAKIIKEFKEASDAADNNKYLSNPAAIDYPSENPENSGHNLSDRPAEANPDRKRFFNFKWLRVR
jgi:hypothetical protein